MLTTIEPHCTRPRRPRFRVGKGDFAAFVPNVAAGYWSGRTMVNNRVASAQINIDEAKAVPNFPSRPDAQIEFLSGEPGFKTSCDLLKEDLGRDPVAVFRIYKVL